MAENRDLEALYLATQKATFGAPTIEEAKANWDTYVSPRFVAERNGVKFNSESYKEAMIEVKTQFPDFDVRWKKFIVGPRQVAALSYIWVPSAGLWFDSSCFIEFGEVGTEDEKRAVKFVEVVELGPKDRDPNSDEAKSITVVNQRV